MSKNKSRKIIDTSNMRKVNDLTSTLNIEEKLSRNVRYDNKNKNKEFEK